MPAAARPSSNNANRALSPQPHSPEDHTMPTEDLRTTVGADIATSPKPAGEPAPESLASGKRPPARAAAP